MVELCEEADALVLRSSFAIVAIGASAEGIEACIRLLSALPTDTGMAFVLIQHLKADQPSFLAEILSRTTSMPVIQAQDGMAVKQNHVYVIPPDRQMEIISGLLTLAPRQQTNDMFMTVNSFFCSLAKDRGKKAIGVVLSGSDGDGALGLKAIKAAGGIAFAQDVQSAQFPGMPYSAASIGLLDFVLPPWEIAAQLAALGHHPYLAPQVELDTVPVKAVTTEDVRQTTIALLHAATGVDFSQYKRPTFERRLQRRMAMHQLESSQEYMLYLRDNPEEVQSLYRDVLISVTGFFRDLEVFENVKSVVLPAITQQKAKGLPLRIWVGGCSTGEEVYTLAICVLEFLEEHPSQTPVQIFGTDLSEEAIAFARDGLYHASQTEGLSPQRLQKFFVQDEGNYQICRQVRQLCIFAHHNLLADPPFSRMDLVSCRNVLIYFTPPAQKRVLTTFHYSLRPTGFLLLGASESLRSSTDLFDRVDSRNKLYSRKEVSAWLPLEFGARAPAVNLLNLSQRVEVKAVDNLDLQKQADQTVLDHYAPVGVLIDPDWEILSFRGKTSPYLKPAPGPASLNLLKVVHPGLRSKLRSALQEAKKQSLAQSRQNINLYDSERERRVRIDVAPLKHASGQTHFLVLFTDSPSIELLASLPHSRSATVANQSSQQQLLELQQELTAKEEYLRTAIEESEAVSQNLRVASEEIISSNEELQSTNEELQTAKEEIQSTNEELCTMNGELHRRNHELDQHGNDLQNLLASTQIPIVMLDGNQRIQHFTPLAGELLHFVPSDVGRSIHEINHQLSILNLPESFLEVIESKCTHTQEVQDRNGHWHELSIHPYRIQGSSTDGAVLVLMNIDQRRCAAEEAKAARDYAEAIVETLHEPLIVLDAQLHTVTVNRAFYELFEADADQAAGQSLFDLNNDQWDVPRLREGLEAVLEGGSLKDFEVDREFEQLGRKVLLLNARCLPSQVGTTLQILLSMSDTTACRQLEEERAGLLAVQREERGRGG